MGIESSAALATPVAALVSRGDLLVPGVDELDPAAARQRREHGDVGMAAEAEDMLDAARLEVLHEQVGDGVFHAWFLPQFPGGTARRAGPL
jgi:hypothetical protein